MSAHVKVMRLLGAGMVALAVVPWVGISPAAATGNGHGDRSDQAAHAKADQRGKAEKKAENRAENRAEKKAEAQSASKADARSGTGAKSGSKSGAKPRNGSAQKPPAARAQAKGPKSDPPGNNGTVKVHEEQEPSPVVKNQPKVCTFHLHGFNFDGSSSGTWEIDGHAPTSGNTGASGAWTADTDGVWRTAQMTLEPGHYKVYAEQTQPATPGGFKQKVFWVRCGENGGGSTPPTTPTDTSTTTSTSTPTETVTETVSPTATVTVTQTVTVTATPTTATATVTTTAPGSTTTAPGPTTTAPGPTVTVTETVTVGPGGVGVLPTKIGNATGGAGGGGGGGGDTGVLGTKTGGGVLAATGLKLPMGAALGLSFALLIAGAALMILPARLAEERARRH